jgi:hypothetical protein
MGNVEPISMGHCRTTIETEKAICVTDLEMTGGKPQWIPKSAIHDNSEVWKMGQDGELVVHGWLAEKNGWI